MRYGVSNTQPGMLPSDTIFEEENSRDYDSNRSNNSNTFAQAMMQVQNIFMQSETMKAKTVSVIAPRMDPT